MSTPARGEAAAPPQEHGPAGAPALLETRGLCCSFGALAVTRDVSLSLERGARHALIGPNGAGKSTFVNLLSGRVRQTRGEILLEGRAIQALRPFERVRKGLARTFQVNALFAELSPLDSVALAICQGRQRALSFLGVARVHREALDEAAAILERVGLQTHLHTQTRHLAYGHQRLLEVALALACRPKVLLLDEPAAGVPAAESRRLFDTLGQLDPDLAILLIEHDMELVFRFASRISVLADGALLAQGAPDEIARNPDVKRAYLGDGHV